MVALGRANQSKAQVGAALGFQSQKSSRPSNPLRVQSLLSRGRNQITHRLAAIVKNFTTMDAHKDKTILKKHSVALVSNHKWQNLFDIMAKYGSDLCGIEYRFTDTDRVLIGDAPKSPSIWDSAIDNPVHSASGLVEYKHIESISIPTIYK